MNNFEEHLQFLKNHNYKTLTIDEFYKWKQGKLKLPIKSVLITFDDGFLSNYEYAFPLLKKYNMNATVFVVGKYSDEATNNKWNGNIKEYMSTELIKKAIVEYPNIDFCSHSYNLHYRESLNENDRIKVLEDAQKFSENILKTKFFAYPFGAYNDNLVNGIKDGGIEMSFIYGPNKEDYRKASLKDNNFKIPRINTSAGMPIWKFALRLWIWP